METFTRLLAKSFSAAFFGSPIMLLVAIYATDPTPIAGKPIFSIRPSWDISIRFLKDGLIEQEYEFEV